MCEVIARTAFLDGEVRCAESTAQVTFELEERTSMAMVYVYMYIYMYIMYVYIYIRMYYTYLYIN